MTKAKPLSVALVSLGCPKNLVDGEKMLALLAEGGCVVGAPVEEADVVVVNTCGFLAAAREESLSAIREAVARKRAGRCRRVVVAGCLSTRDGKKLHDLVPGIDAVIGVADRDGIVQAALSARRVTRLSGPKRAHFGFRIAECGLGTRPDRANPQSAIRNPQSRWVPDDTGRFRLTPRHTAYLRISEGCSRKCTFCTIPAIRGPYRSKPPQAVLREARELVADGAVELNVIAQDTTGYGMDFADAQGFQSLGFNLASLLRELDKLDGLRWIRLLYTYPRRFTDRLIETIAACPRVVPYVDLPLQHVSDPILRRMGRGVTRKGVETLLGKLRRRIPGLVLRTTFIVGFPGETEGQFRELLEFVKGFRFESLGVFEFSAEEGTPAASMLRQVSPAVKAQRAKEIMLAQQEIAFAASARKVGSPIEVLVDGDDRAGRRVGRYYGQAPDIDGLCILKRRRRPGSFVRTKVVGWSGYDLIVD
jgi:ribosomal protein S12 methylthiotransferase